MNQANYEKIQELAYYKWIEAGSPDDADVHFWVEAEKEITGGYDEQFYNAKQEQTLLDSDGYYRESVFPSEGFYYATPFAIKIS